MRIEVERLSEQGEAFAHTYEPAELTLDEEGVNLIAPARVEGRAVRKGEQVRVKGTISARIEAPCDRCVQPVSLPVELDFEGRFEPVGTDALTTEQAELQPEDLDFSVYEDGAVDIDALVREQILLSLPTRLLCREDCKGLCANCGADLNQEPCSCQQHETDPRWAALKNL